MTPAKRPKPAKLPRPVVLTRRERDRLKEAARRVYAYLDAGRWL